MSRSRERVGDDNIFIFGLTAHEVAETRARGIDARETIGANPRLREALNALATGAFSPDDKNRYAQLVDALTYYDHFLIARDFASYCTRKARSTRAGAIRNPGADPRS